ncbi:hypothetical protein CC2G_012345 [Coprinopsis cinerea AmutBmut pab1-1]|nr:hypothetical protein CC2G_012345 [Coprinopsis cinerea AmutBmut pab1-1]
MRLTLAIVSIVALALQASAVAHPEPNKLVSRQVQVPNDYLDNIPAHCSDDCDDITRTADRCRSLSGNEARDCTCREDTLEDYEECLPCVLAADSSLSNQQVRTQVRNTLNDLLDSCSAAGRPVNDFDFDDDDYDDDDDDVFENRPAGPNTGTSASGTSVPSPRPTNGEDTGGASSFTRGGVGLRAAVGAGIGALLAF